jgi:hypothetical protein
MSFDLIDTDRGDAKLLANRVHSFVDVNISGDRDTVICGYTGTYMGASEKVQTAKKPT